MACLLAVHRGPAPQQALNRVSAAGDHASRLRSSTGRGRRVAPRASRRRATCPPPGEAPQDSSSHFRGAVAQVVAAARGNAGSCDVTLGECADEFARAGRGASDGADCRGVARVRLDRPVRHLERGRATRTRGRMGGCSSQSWWRFRSSSPPCGRAAPSIWTLWIACASLLLAALWSLEPQLLVLLLWLTLGTAAVALPSLVERWHPVRLRLQVVPLAVIRVTGAPWLAYAWQMAANNRQNRIDTDITASVDHYSLQAAMGLAVLLLAILSACWPRGRQQIGPYIFVTAAYFGALSCGWVEGPFGHEAAPASQRREAAVAGRGARKETAHAQADHEDRAHRGQPS